MAELTEGVQQGPVIRAPPWEVCLKALKALLLPCQASSHVGVASTWCLLLLAIFTGFMDAPFSL